MKLLRNTLITIALNFAPILTTSAQVVVWVDAGGFTNPPYNFALDEEFAIPFDIQAGGEDALDINQTYIFRRANEATSHPFYVSDQGQDSEPININLSGDGSTSIGISGAQSFELSFDGFNPETDTLTYWCTTHSNMVSTFNVIPEPSTYVALFGGIVFTIVFLRRKFS